MRVLKGVLALVLILVFGRAVSFVTGRSVPLLGVGATPPAPSEAARTARGHALAKAQVFMPVLPDVGAASLDRHANDDRPFPPDRPLDCRFVPDEVSGTTPKFECELADGEVVKVKYGRTPEIHAEIAATRLLAALGFGADRVSLVHTLRCTGCPPSPFRVRQAAEILLLDRMFNRTLDYSVTRTFTDVAVERKFPGTPIEAESIKGWDFTDLKGIDPAAGGASRHDVDALRLMAVILAHWDNKAVNQRLVCLDKISKDQSTSCEHPLVMLQDLGATFGPSKVDLERWAGVPVWQDETRCLTSMSTLPYAGVSYQPIEISEGGRLRLASRIGALTRRQLEDLFTHAGFPDTRDVASLSWASVLEQKIRAIVDRAPCPSAG